MTAFDPSPETAEVSRRLAERELELAQRIMEIETELQERRWAETELRRQADELARVNQELEQFAYVVSHDLQAPLRGISGFSRLLRRRLTGAETQDSEAVEYLDLVDESAKRLFRLIGDLLEYSRTGRRVMERRPVDLGEVSHEAVATLKAVLVACGGEVVVEGTLPRVLGDPVPLAQLFRNLYDNALKYMTPGQAPRITVSAAPVPVPATDGVEDLHPVLAEIRFHDNGIGIDPEYLERIFIVLQRLHTEEDYPGTGVGLSVCRKIAERHGGWLHAESAGEGHGSTFVLTLPLAPPVRP